MAYFRTGASDYSSLQYNNLTPGNIKNGVTVTVKDPNNVTLKSVTGTYTAPAKSFNCNTKRRNDNTYAWQEMSITNIQNISSITIKTHSSFYQGDGYIKKNGTTVKTISSSDMDCTYTVTGLTNGSYINVKSIVSYNGYDNDYIEINAFS